MPQTISDHPPMAARPSAPRQRLRYTRILVRGAPARFCGRALSGVVMEIFHMRVMQPAVEQCLARGVYLKDRDTTGLLREIDALSHEAVAAASSNPAARVVLLAVTGLVQSVRNRWLSHFEAEEDLKRACSLLGEGSAAGRSLPLSA